MSIRSRDFPMLPNPAISLIHTEVSRMQAGDCLVLFDGRFSTLAGLLQHFWRERRNRRQATRCLHSHGRAGGGLSGLYKDAIKSSLSETLGHSSQCSLHLSQVNQDMAPLPRWKLGTALPSAVSHRVSLHRRSVARFQNPGSARMS